MKPVHVKTYYRVWIPFTDHMYICQRPIIDQHHCLSPCDHSAFTYDIIPLYTKGQRLFIRKNLLTSRVLCMSHSKKMLKNCISSSFRQYINFEGQRFSKRHHYKHSSGVFLSIQHRCRCISPFRHCRLKSFLPRSLYPIKHEITT